MSKENIFEQLSELFCVETTIINGKEYKISRRGKFIVKVTPSDATGIQVRWHENGQLAERCEFKDGKAVGVKECWHENGQLAERCEFKDGDAVGVKECWHENGQLAERCEFKDGKAVGVNEFWNKFGVQLPSRFYIMGKLDAVKQSEIEIEKVKAILLGNPDK